MIFKGDNTFYTWVFKVSKTLAFFFKVIISFLDRHVLLPWLSEAFHARFLVSSQNLWYPG